MNGKKGLNKKLIALIIAITAVIAFLLFIYVPPQPELELSAQNSDIYSLLVAAGIKDALVDVTREQVMAHVGLEVQLITFKLLRNIVILTIVHSFQMPPLKIAC